MQSNFMRLVFVLILYNYLIINEAVVLFRYAVFTNILLIHSILSCKLFAYICKFLYLYIINLADIYA